VRRRTAEGCLFRARRRRREASYWYKSKVEMKFAPSTPTVSIAATISSPVTCGGRAGTVELLTGIEGASSRPVRRIVLIEG
jgi:hypothetical protein